MSRSVIVTRTCGLGLAVAGLLVVTGAFDQVDDGWLQGFGGLLALGGLLVLSSQRRALAARTAAANDQARLGAVEQSLREGLLTLAPDASIESVNPAACRLFSYSAPELVGCKLRTLVAPEMHAILEPLLDVAGHGNSMLADTQGLELQALRRDGSRFDMELSMNRVEARQRTFIVCTVRDISERKRTQQALHAEKERLRLALGTVSDAVITTDLAGHITYLNPVAEMLTGWPQDAARGQALELVFHVISAGSRERAPNPVSFVLSNGQTGGQGSDTLLLARDGTEFFIDNAAVPIRDQGGAIIGAVLVFRDISEQRLLQERMSHEARHDGLTGLVNRREFERLVLLALEGAPCNRGHVLMYLDLDQFKIVNDTCGHVAGDEMLKQVASLLQGQLRTSDVLARLGGDEFAVLLQNCPLEAGQRVAEMLRNAVANCSFNWGEKSYGVTVSIGLVRFQEGEVTLSEVLMAADSSCFVAKDKGRNRVHVFEPQDAEQERRSGEMSWVSRIRRALQEQRFCLYAQPIADVSHVDAAFVHFELLIRMRDEQGELVPPMAFIPAAERYNLMPQIDRWVIQHAFDFLEQALRDGALNLRFAINLSGASLNDETLLPFILEQFATHDVPRDAVCFEVTETSAISNLRQASRLIADLKQAGCQFSLDDFGAGMSSFAYLKHLPVDYLKIDGGFVKDMAEDPIDRAMVEAINTIGQVMGIKTIAEFVENERILECLSMLGVNYAQGYGISRPFPMEQLAVQRASLAAQ